ncbi:MAG TPA: hypothetical protein DIW51_19530, partial [Rhodospirillaceae bacterium]|nr:hypothetical protein [Rhodospirillaceae bacterium]
VIMDNQASNTHTVIEINGHDRPGFLYDVTSVLTQEGLQIASAQITTYGERVVDVFYVKDIFGLKIRHADKLKSIETRLLERIGGKKAVKAAAKADKAKAPAKGSAKAPAKTPAKASAKPAAKGAKDAKPAPAVKAKTAAKAPAKAPAKTATTPAAKAAAKDRPAAKTKPGGKASGNSVEAAE